MCKYLLDLDLTLINIWRDNYCLENDYDSKTKHSQRYITDGMSCDSEHLSIIRGGVYMLYPRAEFDQNRLVVHSTDPSVRSYVRSLFIHSTRFAPCQVTMHSAYFIKPPQTRDSRVFSAPFSISAIPMAHLGGEQKMYLPQPKFIFMHFGGGWVGQMIGWSAPPPV